MSNFVLFCLEYSVTRSCPLAFRVVGTRHPRSLHLFFEYVTKSLKCQRSGMLTIFFHASFFSKDVSDKNNHSLKTWILAYFVAKCKGE